MTYLNASSTEIYEYILEGTKDLDDDLTIENLEALIQIFPKEREAEIIRGYKGKVEDLDKTEKFIYRLMQISRFEAKLGGIILRRSMKDKCSEIREDLELIRQGYRSIRKNKRLRLVIKNALILGNRLNNGTFKGNAKAFRLEGLLRMADTRINREGSELKNEEKNKIKTMLDFFFSRLEKLDPQIWEIVEELKPVRVAAGISSDILENDIRRISEKFDLLKKEIELSREDSFEYYSNLNEFFTNGEDFLTELDNFRVEEMEKEKKKCYRYLGQNEEDDDVLGVVDVFINLIKDSGKRLGT